MKNVRELSHKNFAKNFEKKSKNFQIDSKDFLVGSKSRGGSALSILKMGVEGGGGLIKTKTETRLKTLVRARLNVQALDTMTFQFVGKKWPKNAINIVFGDWFPKISKKFQKKLYDERTRKRPHEIGGVRILVRSAKIGAEGSLLEIAYENIMIVIGGSGFWCEVPKFFTYPPPNFWTP